MVNVMMIHKLGVNVSFGGEHGRQRAAEHRKQYDWENFADRAQCESVPLSIESYGKLGMRAEEYVWDLRDAI